MPRLEDASIATAAVAAIPLIFSALRRVRLTLKLKLPKSPILASSFFASPPRRTARQLRMSIFPEPQRTSRGAAHADTRLSGQFQLLREGAFLQSITDEIDLLAAVDPGRHCAARPRSEFSSYSGAGDKGGAADRFARLSVEENVLVEIDETFVGLKHGFDWEALGVNHVMAFDFDVKIFQLVVFGRVEPPDCHLIHEASGGDEHPV